MHTQRKGQHSPAYPMRLVATVHGSAPTSTCSVAVAVEPEGREHTICLRSRNRQHQQQNQHIQVTSCWVSSAQRSPAADSRVEDAEPRPRAGVAANLNLLGRMQQLSTLCQRKSNAIRSHSQLDYSHRRITH